MLDLSFAELEKQFEIEEEKNLKIFNELLLSAKRENTIKMDAWKVANIYYQIVNSPLFLMQFSDIKEFAKYAGVNKSIIQAYIRAIQFDKKHNLDHNLFSVSQVFELCRIDNDYDNFAASVDMEGQKINNLSVSQIRNFVDRYQKKEEEMVDISFQGGTYRMPLRMFKKYAKKIDNGDDKETLDVMNSHSWMINDAKVAYKKIDKSVFISKGTGIPEDTRWFWGIEHMNPGESKTIAVICNKKTYKFILKRDLKPEPYRTKMFWHKDFADLLEKVLNFSVWEKNSELYYFAFEKKKDDYYLDIVKRIK